MPRREEPISKEEVATDQKSAEIKLNRAVESFGESAKDLFRAMLEHSEIKDDPNLRDLISELRTKLERERAENKDPFDIERIAKTLTNIDERGLEMLKNREFQGYVRKLNDFVESESVLKADKGQLFFALEAVANLTKIKERSKREDLFQGIERHLKALDSSGLSEDAKKEYFDLMAKSGLVSGGSKNAVMKYTLRDSIDNDPDLLGELRNFFQNRWRSGDPVGIDNLLRAFYSDDTVWEYSQDKIKIRFITGVGMGSNFDLTGEVYEKIRQRAGETMRRMLPVLNYYRQCRPEKHGFAFGQTYLFLIPELKVRLKVEGLLEDKAFFDLFEEDGVVLSELEGSDALNDMAKAAFEKGNEDYETLYKSEYEKKEAFVAETGRNLFYNQKIWGTDLTFHGRSFYEVSFDDLSDSRVKEHLKELEEQHYRLFPFLQKCVKSIKMDKKGLDELGQQKEGVELEQEITENELRSINMTFGHIRELMKQYGDLQKARIVINKQEKLYQMFNGIRHKIKDEEFSLRSDYEALKERCGQKYGSRNFDWEEWDNFFANDVNVRNFDNLQKAMSDYLNINDLLRRVASGITRKNFEKLEKGESRMKMLVEMYKIAYAKLMEYQSQGLEIPDDKLAEIKIDPEVLSQYSEE